MYAKDEHGQWAAIPGGLLDTCKHAGEAQKARYGLKGDLELEDTLKGGLEGLQ